MMLVKTTSSLRNTSLITTITTSKIITITIKSVTYNAWNVLTMSSAKTIMQKIKKKEKNNMKPKNNVEKMKSKNHLALAKIITFYVVQRIKIQSLIQ